MDDEYAFAGEADPKILVTTSRDPSSRLTQFAKVRRHDHKTKELRQQNMLHLLRFLMTLFLIFIWDGSWFVVPSFQRVSLQM